MEEMATHSSVLAWRVPGTGEPGGLPSVGSHRVGHEAKNSAVLLSHDGYLLEPTVCPKGSQASCAVWIEDSGFLSRPCRKRRPSFRDDGGVSWVF